MVFSLSFLLWVSPSRAQFQQLGGAPLAEGSRLAFGGSLNPPTLEHMGVLARMMHRFGFLEARLMPTVPYKPGAGTPEQIVDVSSVAVDHFDEVLGLNGIAYRKDAGEGSGDFRWSEKGVNFNLKLDLYDIRTNNKENTLQTLDYLREDADGDARRVFWLSGGDSFASVPSWMENWRDMFERANWVVIARPGFEGVDFHEENPLARSFDAEFLSHYNYSFDAENQVHNYVNKDPAKPGIYVVSQPMLNFSSSVARTSIAEKGDHHLAQAGLQPSVFRRSLEKGYYAKSEGDYRAFTEANLGIYLHHVLAKLEATGDEAQHREWQSDFHSVSSQLVALLAQNRENASRSTLRSRALEWMAGAESLLKRARGAVRTHLRVYRALGHQRSTYRRLRNDRHRLLRGDPDLVYARTLEHGLGLDGAALEVNLIRSRLSPRLPLWVRQHDDRRVTWHDLNVSSNEMAAMLQDRSLVAAIRRVAGTNAVVLTTLLRQAIESSPRALIRYQLFLGARYYQRIALGGVHSPEILGGFSEREQSVIREFQTQYADIGDRLTEAEVRTLSEALGYIYALNRTLHRSPKLWYEISFWEDFRRLVVTGYPGMEIDPFNAQHTQRKLDLMPLIEAGMSSPQSREWLPFVAHLIGARSERPASDEVGIHSATRLRHAVEAYASKHGELLLSKPVIASSVSSFEVRPVATLGENVSEGNLIWEIKKFFSLENRRYQEVEAAFRSALLRLDAQPTHAAAHPIFSDAHAYLSREWRAAQFDLQKLEYRILLAKSVAPFAASESQIENYDELVEARRALETRMQDQTERLRSLTHSMLGSISMRWDNEATLKSDVGRLLGLDQGAATLLGKKGWQHRCSWLLNLSEQ
ncbi:MAG TPA: hypothetical protein VM901_05150 [Bdellovibrionota bacterium]|nr:hypothetical protein [Bdellovibrionota bacterium]